MSRGRLGGACVLDKDDLAHSETAYEFHGHHHDAGVSFIMIDALPESGPKLHKHPYEEIFVVQEAVVPLTAGGMKSHSLWHRLGPPANSPRHWGSA
jgi:hypothetical protein